MKNDILSALNSIPVSQLSYQEWINVGFALKNDGYDCSVWDLWSRNDVRYHQGECFRKWQSFSGSENPITGATIIQMAQKYGWHSFEGNGFMDWNDSIEYDGERPTIDTFNPVKELRTYLSVLFKTDDHVSYVTTSFRNNDGKYCPCGMGCSDRTAGQLLDALNKYPNDLGAVIGDWNPEAGAWIRFNAVDGKGIKNENVTSFKYALVESDSMSLFEQNKLYRDLNLPIAVLVSSGGKSLHAIVHIDAEDLHQYKERVEILYTFLKEKGVQVDVQNRNPSRLSRLPGVTRGDSVQKIEGINIGCSSWDEWRTWLEGSSDDMPEVESLEDYKNNPPALPPALIDGILRCGHKMLISGSSKAGKSFLLMELAVSLAEGKPWLGFNVRQGKVLYVNLEIDPASCINRFLNIYKAMNLPCTNMENISLWNLRGKAVPLDKLVPKIVRKISGKGYEAVIIDPIYKVITGDENNASEMGAFCNLFDKICSETGCAAIYCHHHSKGSQGAKKAMDRASGSGVFSRDPDAQLDIIELELTEEIINKVRDGNATGWRMEGSLREFENFKPVNFWFEYPLHRVDNNNLNQVPAEGSWQANLAKSPNRTSEDERHNTITTAFEMCQTEDEEANLNEMAEYMGISAKTMRRYVKEFSGEFSVSKSIVKRSAK